MLIINGTTIGHGKNNIVVINGKVYADGTDVTPDSKEISITIEGNLEHLEVDYCSKISIKGDVGSIKSASGDIDITGNVNSGIQTASGDVECSDVHGSIKSMSGDISCENVAGSVSTMSGNIKHRK